MKYKKYLIGLIAYFLSSGAFAEEPQEMPSITAWSGPFKETRIIKYADYSEGVACYVYIPTNVRTSLYCSGGGCATQYVCYAV